jgi:Fic family protein
MRIKEIYIHQKADWPNFYWKQEAILEQLSEVRNMQGRIMGRMEGFGFKGQEAAVLKNLTIDVIKTSDIEGENLPENEVRSSIARRLGITIEDKVKVSRSVEGIVEITLDACTNFEAALTKERLCNWHAALFPTGRSGMHKITVGDWRKDDKEPMQVVSGAMGKEKIHFVAPESLLLESEMNTFLFWFNNEQTIDPVIKAALAHFWFITIHPFDDGNGRIARVVADMQLARSDKSAQRFYSMSAQIREQRNDYYGILEKCQQGTMDITAWMKWFLQCLQSALGTTSEVLSKVLVKSNFWEQHNDRNLNARQRNMLNKILDGFEGKLNTSKWAKINKCSADTALRDIQALIEMDILMKEEGEGKNTSYKLVAEGRSLQSFAQQNQTPPSF